MITSSRFHDKTKGRRRSSALHVPGAWDHADGPTIDGRQPRDGIPGIDRISIPEREREAIRAAATGGHFDIQVKPRNKRRSLSGDGRRSPSLLRRVDLSFNPDSLGYCTMPSASSSAGAATALTKTISGRQLLGLS